MNDLLVCSDCSFGYDSSRLVLKDVSFTLKSGEFVALLGPNGAGKSTLMKLILHRMKLLSGAITLNGMTVSSMDDRQIAGDIGYVEQTTPQSSMEVFDFVLLGAISRFAEFRFWFSREEKMRAEELLADLGIYHLKNHSVDKISGGEQQLVQICRALMSTPKLLLLDEPVSHLDIQHINTVIRLLIKIKTERNVAILSSIHDIHLACSCSDRMLLLDGSGELSDVANPKFPEPGIFSKVFNADFETAELSENHGKVFIPRYRFR